MTPGWRRLRLAIGCCLLAAGAVATLAGGWQASTARAQNARIAALAAGHGLPPGTEESAPVSAARARALLARGDIEAAQAIADRLAAAPPALRASLLYALGNANLRHGLTILPKLPFRQVRPFLSLAKSEYRQVLQIDPDDWDARYNFALAAALVRDSERAQPTVGDEMAHERAAWPDIPGAPNGMP